jgi:hypothetical protein
LNYFLIYAFMYIFLTIFINSNAPKNLNLCRPRLQAANHGQVHHRAGHPLAPGVLLLSGTTAWEGAFNNNDLGGHIVKYCLF